MLVLHIDGLFGIVDGASNEVTAFFIMLILACLFTGLQIGRLHYHCTQMDHAGSCKQQSLKTALTSHHYMPIMADICNIPTPC